MDVLIESIEVLLLLLIVISLRAYGKYSVLDISWDVLSSTRDLWIRVYLSLKNISRPLIKPSLFILVRNPNLPVFIPSMGILLSFINGIALSKVPSPPIVNKTSTSFTLRSSFKFL
tara:strand:- start:1726 stop:2073 length:348 start_codon:yes stop_codon:yes gene_type:complete